jgi:SCY1-like protein 2
MAPEYSTTKSYDSQSDMFSLGMLIYALYNHGKTLYECHDNYSAFVRMSDDLKVLNIAKLSVLPMEVREHVKMLLSVRPELRPDARQFSKVRISNKDSKKFLSNYLGTVF